MALIILSSFGGGLRVAAVAANGQACPEGSQVQGLRRSGIDRAGYPKSLNPRHLRGIRVRSVTARSPGSAAPRCVPVHDTPGSRCRVVQVSTACRAAVNRAMY